MRARLAALALILAGITPAQTDLTADLVLSRVQSNLTAFVKLLPDFVCTEKIDSSKTVNGTVTEHTTAESRFTGVQRPYQRVGFPFTETREPVTINGRPAVKGEKLRGPAIFGGGFSSVLHATFGPETREFQTYKLAGTELLDGKLAIVLEFATRKDQSEMALSWEGKRVVTRDTGRAWIDPESFQVLRLERTYTKLPRPVNRMEITVVYGPVTIGDRTFHMPKSVEARVHAPSKHEVREFIAHYEDYKKFNVTSGITYVNQ